MSLYLLWVPLGVRQLGGHMEHDLLIVEVCVDRFCPRLPVSDIQAAPKSGEEEGNKDGGRIRGRGNKIYREDEKKKREEMKWSKEQRDDRGERPQGRQRRGEQSSVGSGTSERPVNSRSSITGRTPRALLLPTPSQFQEHRKYQDTLNRLFQEFIL